MTPKTLAEVAGCSVEPRKDAWGNSESLLINSNQLPSFNNEKLGLAGILHSIVGPRSAGLVQAS